MKPRLLLSPLGLLINEDGFNVAFDGIDETEISVPHLREHVSSFNLPKGEVFHVKIVYTCHCWTRSFDPERDQDRMIIWDHKRPRVYCPIRYGASLGLKETLEGLARHTIYNASSRNYGAFNATVKTQDGEFYTAFFTMERQRGSWDGQRHRFLMRVESAYFDPQLGRNKRVTLAGVFAKLN